MDTRQSLQTLLMDLFNMNEKIFSDFPLLKAMNAKDMHKKPNTSHRAVRPIKFLLIFVSGMDLFTIL
jgi:hypothetical protein